MTGLINGILHLSNLTHSILVLGVERVIVMKSRLMLHAQVNKLLGNVLKLVSNKLGLSWAWWRALFGKYRELQRLTLQYARILDISLEDGSVDVEQMDVEA
ncbi:hypothetical protein FOXG_06417 [Fusarium oxysporum f. sp. lycopersici 4287]|uniref:Uncharacterized protein n=2 Tax=Fusarium oxysporum TaxID=5507 RepID=A0A0J9UYN5_FUSO4|nr:hypothetical protein FOXG_06417 [Fusarium oxysporum f. sp. lycopersici 4287]KNB04225.1 hypothetical protein FOXG_06417 [Fusarium oxysporum f. sp. lycopersici 4287]